jgi:hypothetical protein
MKKRNIILPFYLILLCAISILVGAQDNEQKAFSSVPESVRARLIERFQLLVLYETTEQWDLLYELLEPRYAKGKDEYVALRRRNSLRSAEKWIFGFVPERTEEGYTSKLPADYKVVGYAKVKERGCLVKRNGIVYAFLQNGEWYLSGFIVELATSHSPPAPCLSQ